jgi:hypothetical protein
VAKSLPSSVYSPDHLRYCINELESYANVIEMIARGAQGKELPALSRESLDLLDAFMADKDRRNGTAINGLTQELTKLQETAKVVSITLAATAPHGLKEELVTWLRTNITPELLVEFHVNPDIAGGLVLRSFNRVFDESFRNHLLTQPERFTRILDGV